MKKVSKKTYTIEQANTNQLSEYQKQDLTELIKRSEEINVFYPCKVYLNFDQYEDGQEYYHYSEIRATYKETEFFIKFWEQTKKYHIYPTELTSKFKNIDNYTISRIQENIKEPQKIGVVNLKKLVSWFEYHLAVIDEAQKIDATNGSEEEKFLKSIEGLPVQWDRNGKSGEILQNGILFKFSIGPTYISKKVEINYNVSNELESFLKLSKNQYNH
jgi:hypothetical protein